MQARRVVIATGIGDFTQLPSQVQALPGTLVSHSSQHADLSAFKGARVAVLGAGASALDIAALLNQAGASVDLIARTDSLKFHDPPREPRPLMKRIKEPRSGLGTGWRSRPHATCRWCFMRSRIASPARGGATFGPAPCWFVRDAVVGQFPMHLGARLEVAEPAARGLRVVFSQRGEKRTLEADHLIAATGFKVELSRLKFLNEPLRTRIRSVAGSPILGRRFDSSIRGLYFVGIAAANSFGPLLRFAFGADYTARRLGRHLAAA